METTPDLEQLPNALGVAAGIDESHGLPVMTETINALCDKIAEGPTGVVAVLQLTGGATAGREWPGEVGIQEVNRWERAVRRLKQIGAVSLLVAQGTCGGPTFDLLLATDY